MKIAFVSVVIFLSISNAYAIERINTPSLNCAQIQNKLTQLGEAILRYPSTNIANYKLYDRYVASDRFCNIRETTTPKYVPAKNTPHCLVFICAEMEPLFPPLFNN